MKMQKLCSVLVFLWVFINTINYFDDKEMQKQQDAITKTSCTVFFVEWQYTIQKLPVHAYGYLHNNITSGYPGHAKVSFLYNTDIYDQPFNLFCDQYFVRDCPRTFMFDCFVLAYQKEFPVIVIQGPQTVQQFWKSLLATTSMVMIILGIYKFV